MTPEVLGTVVAPEGAQIGQYRGVNLCSVM